MPDLDPLRRVLRASTRWLAPVSLLIGLGWFAGSVQAHIPIGDWLFPRYLDYWLAVLVWSAGCLSAGHAIWRRLRPGGFRIGEEMLLSFALGVLTVFLVTFLAGLLHLLYAPFFVLLPPALIAIGARGLVRRLRRAVRAIRHARRRPRPPAPLWQLPAMVAGVLAVALLYLPVLAPSNIAYDARWYHVPLAERYVALRAIRPAADGWWGWAVPHLTSILYTWPFGLPWLRLFDRIEIAAHIEFVLFLATLSGLPLVVRRLVPGVRARYAWLALFLFPGIFLYDSSLIAAADHVTAFWALPIALALARMWREFTPRPAVILGALLAAALLTKYQGIYLVVGAGVPVAVRFVMLAVRFARAGGGEGATNPWPGALAVVGTLIAVSAPHWLKNLIFYGDPVFPFLHRRLAVHPWTQDGPWVLQNTAMIDRRFEPPAGLWPRLRDAAKLFVSFSVKPNDYPMFHGNRPVFGSLFTVFVLALPFLRAGRRLWGFTAVAALALFTWAATYHADRYLQIILPWMAAVTAAALIYAHRAGVFPRVVAGVLVAFQLGYAVDVPFLHGHAIMGTSIYHAVLDLASTTHRKKGVERFRVLDPFQAIGESLPREAVVYVRQMELHAGLGHATVMDHGGFGINLGRMASTKDLHALMLRLGVTHVIWATRYANAWLDNLSADFLFMRYAGAAAASSREFGNVTLAALPDKPPTSGPTPERVLYLGCPTDPYESGIYDRTDMLVLPNGSPERPKPREPFQPIDPSDITPILEKVQYVAYSVGCQPPMPPTIGNRFANVARREKLELWVKRY